jgi:hypothetical protein
MLAVNTPDVLMICRPRPGETDVAVQVAAPGSTIGDNTEIGATATLVKSAGGLITTAVPEMAGATDCALKLAYGATTVFGIETRGAID